MMRGLCWALSLLVSGSVVATPNGHAEHHSHGAFNAEQKLHLDEGQFRAPIPGMSNSVGYMTLTNVSSKDLVFVAAQSKVASRVEFHDHIMENGVMKMIKVDKVEVKASQSLKFQSGGLHLMFIGLNELAQQQKSIKVDLITDEQDVISVVLQTTSIHQHHSHHH